MSTGELSANLPQNVEKTDNTTAPIKEEKPPFCSLTESVFSVIFLFTGYLFIKLFVLHSCGLMAAFFLLATLFASAVLAKLRKADGSRYSKLYFVLAAVFSVGTGLSANGTIRFMSFCFAAVYYAMWAYALNNPEWKGFGKSAFCGISEAAISVPKQNFTACPKAVFGLFHRKNGAKNVGYAVLGLALSVPLTIIVCLLLMSADNGFENMIRSIFDGIRLEGFWNFAFGLPISFLLFGVIFGAVSSKDKLRTDAALYEAKAEKRHFAPSALVCAFIAPLCIIYVLFFFSQLGYFISAFGGILPEEFSAAEYARKGFFELCAVAVINLAVIAVVNAFCRRDGKGTVLKLVTVVLSVFTLILIATAQSKMFLYIDRFGLTAKRVYTSWFMFILAAVFVLIIISRFKEFRVASIGAAIITSASLLLGFCGADGLIARYDAKLIESGIMSEYPEDLSADAVPVISQCLKSENEALAKAARKCYIELLENASEKEWFEKTVSEIVSTHNL